MFRARSTSANAAITGSVVSQHTWKLTAIPVCVALIATVITYPIALAAFHQHYAFAGFDLMALLAVAGAYAVPAFGLWVAWWMGRVPRPTGTIVIARRIAHLVVAAPPAFTILGVVLYLMRIKELDTAAWFGLWAAIACFTGLSLVLADSRAETYPSATQSGRSALRYMHGYVAMATVAVFIVPHLINHLFALRGEEAHASVMLTLRVVYRHEWIEPVLIVLIFFQVLSGIALWRPRTAEPADMLATLQTASGAYLAVYLVSHVNSVFTLARYFGTDTNWQWAVGAPAGLAEDAWNVRLIPHYSLAVFMLLAHLACGLRVVMHAHGVGLRRADAITWCLIAAGGLVAGGISAAMLGVRF